MTDASAAAARETWDIQAVSRAAQILALLGAHREHLDAQEVASLTGLNRTTAHRYLMSMDAAGLLARDGGRFGVGPLVAQLGAHHIARQDVLRVAPEHMRALADEARLTCALTIYGVDAAVIVHVEEDASFDGLVLTVPIGGRLDALSAHGQVWAAFGGVRPAVGRERGDLDEAARAALEEEVRRTREAGVGLRATEDSVFVAIAAPIVADGEMVASLSILGTPATLPPAREGRAVDLLRGAAAAIGGALAR